MQKRLYEKYQNLAKDRGMNLKDYLLMCLELHHNPLPQLPDDSSHEMKEILGKLDELKNKKAELYEQDSFLREQAANQANSIQNKEKIEEKIFRILLHAGMPLSELVIAADPSMNEDADIMLILLSHMEKERIKFRDQGVCYLVKQEGLNWCVRRTN
jgi:hypothetical protein